jgi:hypothetical protein
LSNLPNGEQRLTEPALGHLSPSTIACFTLPSGDCPSPATSTVPYTSNPAFTSASPGHTFRDFEPF